MRIIACFFLLVAVVCASNGVTSSFSSHDAQSASDTIKKSFREGSFNGNLKDTYHALWSLDFLGKPIEKKQEICSFLAKSKPTEISDISYNIRAKALLKCDKWDQIPSAFEKVLVDVLDPKGDTSDIYYAAATLAAVPQKSLVPNQTYLKVLKTLLDRMDDNAMFSETDRSDTKYLTSGLAYGAIGHLMGLSELSDKAKSKLSGIADQIEDLMLLGEDDNDLFYFEEQGESSVRLTASIFAGLANLNKRVQIQLDDAQITGLAQFFIDEKESSTIDSIYFTLRGLDAANSFGEKPLVVEVVTSSLSLSTKGQQLKVKITDLFGKALSTKTKLFLIKASRYGIDSAILENQEFLVENDELSLNFLAVKPNPGYYDLELRVVGDQGEYISVNEARRVVKVTASAAVSHLKIQISERATELDEAREFTAEFPDKIKKEMAAEFFHYVIVSFRLKNLVTQKPVRAHQTGVRFTNSKNGNSVLYHAMRQGNLYKLVLNLQEASIDFAHEAGEYKISVIVGDACLENVIDYEVGQISFNFIKQKKAVQSTEALPPIEHKFRDKPSRPPAVISLTFGIATLAPIGFLVIFWMATGLNGKNFPGGASSIYGLAFVGGIGALAALMVFYFLFLNLFQAFFGLVVIGIWTFLSGRKALAAVASARSKPKAE